MKLHRLLATMVLVALASVTAAEPDAQSGGAIELDSAHDRFEVALASLARNESAVDVASLVSLWRRSADAGVPREALYAFDRVLASSPPGSQQAATARRALDDLERLAAGTDAVEFPQPSEPNSLDAERIETLRRAIDQDREGRDQIEAIAELSLYRGDAIVAALDEAAQRALPSARLAAATALWVVAADCEDPAPLEARLVDYERDADPLVAQLAARAVADLAAMRLEVERH